ncbi:MAG: glycosyl transferase, partial [Candidatus Cloacimonetes bacterium]|nr:glycosyl transferase [Candidatus Cloacimonadota bacterium]
MKILVIRLSSLGDVVLTEPVTRKLKELYPDATIDYITKPAFVPIVRAFGHIDNILEWTGDSQTDLHTVEAEKYDIAIDLHSKLRSRLIRKKANKAVVYNKKHLLRRSIVAKWSNR